MLFRYFAILGGQKGKFACLKKWFPSKSSPQRPKLKNSMKTKPSARYSLNDAADPPGYIGMYRSAY